MSTQSAPRISIIVCPAPWEQELVALKVWTVPVWQRLRDQLSRLDLRPLFLVGPEDSPALPLCSEPEWVSWREIREKAPQADSLLIAAANWILDDLLLQHLLTHGPGVVALRRLDGKGSRFGGAAHLSWSTARNLNLNRGLKAAGEELVGLVREGHCRGAFIEEVSGYQVILRRKRPAFALPVRSPEDTRLAEELILDSTQKGTNDLPAQFIHPPLENALVRILTFRGVSPNAVTTVSILLAFTVAALFYSNHLLAGILAAMVVGVLDGVDGKLARVTLRYSRFGDWYDHFFDYLYEGLWYLALGIGLFRRTGYSVYWPSGGIALCTLYFLDRAALGFWKLFRDYDFHEASATDQTFRRFCARRNTIVYLILPFIILGRPESGFWAALFWWATTFAVHSVRIGWSLLRGKHWKPVPGS